MQLNRLTKGLSRENILSIEIKTYIDGGYYKEMAIFVPDYD